MYPLVHASRRGPSAGFNPVTGFKYDFWHILATQQAAPTAQIQLPNTACLQQLHYLKYVCVYVRSVCHAGQDCKCVSQ